MLFDRGSGVLVLEVVCAAQLLIRADPLAGG
jgi:hypothetical protein